MDWTCIKVECVTYVYWFTLLCSWNEGKNHLIVHMISSNLGSAWNAVFGKAMVAAANFTSSSYRYGFDIAIPVFNNPSQQHATQSISVPLTERLDPFKLLAVIFHPRMLHCCHKYLIAAHIHRSSTATTLAVLMYLALLYNVEFGT